jgi:hypothetical protein
MQTTIINTTSKHLTSSPKILSGSLSNSEIQCIIVFCIQFSCEIQGISVFYVFLGNALRKINALCILPSKPIENSFFAHLFSKSDKQSIIVFGISSDESKRDMVVLCKTFSESFGNRIVFLSESTDVKRYTILFCTLLSKLIRSTIISCVLQKVVLQKTIVFCVLPIDIIKKIIVFCILTIDMNKKTIVFCILTIDMSKKIIVFYILPIDMSKKIIVFCVLPIDMNKKTIVDGGSQYALRRAITAFCNTLYIIMKKDAAGGNIWGGISVSSSACDGILGANPVAIIMPFDATEDDFRAILMAFICWFGMYKTN